MSQNRRRQAIVPTAGPFLLLLLLVLLQTCSPGETPKVRTILPAGEADIVEPLPDGRHIVHGARVLDVATGEDLRVPEVSGMHWIGDGLLYGDSGAVEVEQRIHYVVNLQSLSAVRLDVLMEEDLSAAMIQGADTIFVLARDMGLNDLLLLRKDSSGEVVQGYEVDGVRDLEHWLRGRGYKESAARIECDWGQKVFSPDGRYYYDYVRGESVQIYSEQGHLVNSISVSGLACYGWSWDSGGVYVQERRTGLFVMNPYFGPLQLLEVRP